ncbi:MAG: nucleotidyltransferase domain-containing protein [Coriobacteriales bacterium]|jgi:predicted nucleotidyltransferase|nr:nucleotidyltransferase domain-containing protein [Coriobacteriales bacterium]
MLEIDKIKRVIVPILLEDAKELNQIVLFGSYARGDATEKSDIDIFLDGALRYDSDLPFDAADRATSALGTQVEIITKRALSTSVIRDSLKTSIEREGVLLYG